MVGMHTTAIGADRSIVPTRDTYDALQHAYDHFNWVLFESELPNCLITLQRKGRTFGYFCRKRFVRDDGTPCDEIALNPIHFKSRSLEESLSTLVHEMVHLWQHHFGTSGRGRYHNRQWADKMKSIGLQPSHTGAPGGNELGDQMTHYIVEGGAFAQACKELIGKGYKIEWRDDTPTLNSGAPLPLTKGGALSGAISEPPSTPNPKAGKRVKYSCPACGLNAWAKHGAHLLCGEDQLPMNAT